MTSPADDEVPFTAEMVTRVLEVAGENGILVGGQALALWVAILGVPIPKHPFFAAISKDADFLGNRELVTELGAGLPNSEVQFQLRSAISRLVGVVSIQVANNSSMSIDIIDRVAGLPAARVAKRAITLQLADGKSFKVLHPLDVLSSRVYNIAHFSEKQTDNGRMQLTLALDVGCRYIRNSIRELGEKAALKMIEEVIRLAKSAEGRTALWYGADFIRAIPLDDIQAPNFRKIRIPRIFEELDNLAPQQFLTNAKT